MKKKPKHFIIPLQVYPFDVLVSVDETSEQLWPVLKRYGMNEDECQGILNLRDTARGHCEMFASNQTVIRLFTQDTPSGMASLIAHESFHAVTFILDRVGVKFSLLKSDEAYAYLLDYLVGKIHERI